MLADLGTGKLENTSRDCVTVDRQSVALKRSSKSRHMSGMYCKPCDLRSDAEIMRVVPLTGLPYWLTIDIVTI